MRIILNILSICRVIPVSTVFFFITPGYAMDVTLEWDANSEPDLAGYKVYYKIDSGGTLYYGTGANEGDSPIDVGGVTGFTLTGLDGTKVYFFVDTAYDTEDLESEYSNEGTASTEPTPTPTPSGEGADAGGCFIATAAFGSR